MACRTQEDHRDADHDYQQSEGEKPIHSHTKLSTKVSSTRAIARAIATLAHLESDPKTRGIGPIIITPAPLASDSLDFADISIAATTIPNPRKISTNPTVVMSDTPVKRASSR